MIEKMDEKTTIAQIKKELENFSKERDWKKYHTPKDLAISISIESGELLESFQWLKDEEITQVLNDPKKFHRIKSELADVFAYAFTLSNRLDIDVSEAIFNKINENKRKYPVDKIKGNYRKYSEIQRD